MHPDLQRDFTHVWPLFWRWLAWNLVRVACWHARTGREALMAVDCLGNIRLVCLADAPLPDDLYTYEAPRTPRWEHPALGSDVPVSLCDRVRGPPQAGVLPNSASPTRWRLPLRPHVLVQASTEYTFRAVPENIAALASSGYFAAIFFIAFQ